MIGGGAGVRLRRSLLPMPSVGMRRTTRVFGVVKGLDGARVLRSGRRLWRESSEGKIRRGNDGDEWYKLMDNFGGGLNSEENGWHEVGSKRGVVVDAAKTGGKTAMPKSRKKTAPIDCNDHSSVDKRFGAVYSRKRRKLDAKNSDFSENNKRGCSDDRMYGLHFVRRKRRKRRSESPVVDAGTCSSDDVSRRSQVLIVGVESSCSNACWLSVFLNSVLGYMKRARIRLRELSAFLLSESITDAFSLHGIRFSLDLLCSSKSGICKIFGARQLTPLFSADFSALPLCFIYMHSSMLLRSERLLFVLVIRSENLNVDDEPLTDSEDNLLCTPSMDDLPDSEFVASRDDNLLNRSVLHPIVGAPKLSRRNALCRNGLNSRSIRGKSIRRKRSSLRSRRARNPSLSVHKAYGYFGSEFFSIRNDRSPLSSSVSARGAREAVKSKLVENIKDLKSTAVGLAEDMESTCCSANILVIESDRCYREERANIMLELSSSNQWFLVVKRDGLTRYSHKAENVMRPCASNRFTHDIIWTMEDGWKLEFPNRGDWFIFKELYKECSHRNLQAPVEKFIPVPGVLEVSGYGDSCDAPFLRPDSYITLDGDEVSRALANRTSNYDMDSEDEEWLNQFNNESCAGNDLYEHVTEDNFELMFDAFEKAFYCSPDDYSDEKAASSLCPDLGRREVIQAVYKYWIKKRKQKRSALVSFFQGHQPRRSQLSTESVLRKKRSFKRQPSQCARGKQRLVMQAIAAEKEALHEQNATLNIEEAKVCAKKSAEEAVSKRKRAQLLMEIADLATYKATLALRIAEAARVVELPDVATVYFLD